MRPEELKPVRAAAFRYLKTRDRTVHQMQEHLGKKEFGPEAIDAVIEILKEAGYLDDTRFAERFISNRVETRSWGRRRIADELRKRGISRDIVQQQLEASFEEVDETALALTCAGKKMKSLAGLETLTARRRLAQFLQRKGFGPDTVFKTVDSLIPWRESL